MTDNQQVDAIQQDVPAAIEQVEPPKSNRELAMEAIAETRMRQVNEEMGIPPEASEPVTPTQENEHETVEAQIDAQMTIDDPKGKRVRIKVDGQEQDVPLEDVLRSYQKSTAADKRLEEATRVLKEAKAQAEALASVQEPQQEQPVTPKAGPDELKVAVKTALSKVFEGDEEAAAEELAKVLAIQATPQKAPEAPQIDINAIADQLQQRMQVQNAIEKVKTDYPDLLNDPDLDQFTYLKVMAKEEAGIPRHIALLEAAEEVYQKFGKKAGRQNAPTDSAVREQKLARKAAIDTVPVAHAAAAGVPQEDASPSAVIAEIAARRLGQSLPRR